MVELLYTLRFFLTPIARAPLPPHATTSLRSPHPSNLNQFNRFKNGCIPRALVPTLDRLRRTFCHCHSRTNFGTRLGNLLTSCIKQPDPLCFTRHLATRCHQPSNGNPSVCLGQRSLGRAKTRGVGGTLTRILLTGHVNGRHVVTRAKTKRRKMTATAIYTHFNLRYIVCVNMRSVRQRSLGIFQVQLVNTRIQNITTNANALGSTASRTVHS